MHWSSTEKVIRHSFCNFFTCFSPLCFSFVLTFECCSVQIEISAKYNYSKNRRL